MARRHGRAAAAAAAAALGVVVVSALAAVPAAAAAAAAAAIAAVRLEPTRVGVYVEADVTGAPAAVTARVRRAGEGGGGGGGDADGWADAPPLTRVAAGVYAAKALSLAAGTAYEVEVRAVGGGGADGAAAATTRATTATLGGTPPVWSPATGRTRHVGGPAASAGGDGSAGSPHGRLADAVAAAAPGERLLLHAGVHAGPVTVPPAAAGRADAPVWLTAEPGAVLTTAAAGLAWAPVGGARGGGVHAAALPAGTPAVTTVVAADGTRLFPAASLAGLAGRPGCWHDTAAGRVYVRLPSGGAPDGRVRVATADTAVRVEASHWVLSGLTVGVANGAGVEVVAASGVWVVNNSITSTGSGVVVRGRGGGGVADANVVADNTLTETAVAGWAWDDVKGGPAEQKGVRVAGTAAHTLVRGNTIDGFFNGVYVGSFDEPTDPAVGRLTDVVANTIRRASDDGLEPEGACVGVAFVDNRVANVRTGVSLSPITRGPVYLLRTVIDGYAVSAVKVNNGPTGRVYLYHTTALPGGSAPRGGGGASADAPARAVAPSRPFGGLIATNNLFLSDGYCVEMSWAGALLGDGAAFDYNVWSCRLGSGGGGGGGGGPWFKWRNVRHGSVADLAAATGQEVHGRAAPSRPAFGAGYVPAAGSVAVNAGVRLPGINDGRVVGAGVDVGAVERGL
ncbi:hypothetical protein I4F81_006115 [Pyropia yezoensis]|uniref:Uncharacterized protein n=1 Tax=Pyropia yezoensis TaxID=2788 RepID=A0ACC3C0T3_PYRYE|nr:hypothetical protein I4F81_006115 [Neopyropia yezoensis]